MAVDKIGPRLERDTPVVIGRGLEDRVERLERQRVRVPRPERAPPYPHYARRYHSGGWGPIGALTWYQVGFNMADGGDDSLFWITGGWAYRCPHAGHYRVNMSWAVYPDANLFGVGFGRANIERMGRSSGALGTVTVCATLACNEGDYINFWAGGGQDGQSKYTPPSGDYSTNFVEVLRIA